MCAISKVCGSYIQELLLGYVAEVEPEQRVTWSWLSWRSRVKMRSRTGVHESLCISLDNSRKYPRALVTTLEGGGGDKRGE